MMHAESRASRAAFASSITIMTAGVLLLIVVILGRYGAREMAYQRTALLTVQVEQILLSARDWSRTHSEQVRTAGPIELPLDGLSTTVTTGRLELRCIDSNDGPPLIECSLRISHGARTVMRHTYWPLSSPA